MVPTELRRRSPRCILAPDSKSGTADPPRHCTAEQVGLFFTPREAARLVQRLSAAVREGKRVFAVLGRDHAAHQAEAPHCEFR